MIFDFILLLGLGLLGVLFVLIIIALAHEKYSEFIGFSYDKDYKTVTLNEAHEYRNKWINRLNRTFMISAYVIFVLYIVFGMITRVMDGEFFLVTTVVTIWGIILIYRYIRKATS